MSKQSLGCSLVTLIAVLAATTAALADPCGMVPPIYQGEGPPIVRIGEQQTFVFYKNGVETLVIRPGFSGKVDEFGMLIPFPTAPEIRKVPDHIFPHIAAAVDPPEVVIDLRMRYMLKSKSQSLDRAGALSYAGKVAENKVRVLRKEAVGMYEVAVLEAGSASALKRWVDNHGYRYPDGMDEVCNDYIDQEWCFVAVKTKVGQKGGVDPQPGQRQVNSKLPAGSTFDGHVQAMGFRFESERLVVPMRLSAFNDGELRNIVYLLTDGPKRVRSIPEEYVVRQIAGEQLYRNLTEPLPLRIIGGTAKDLGDFQRRGLAERRNPEPKNGAAKQLFASDLLAIDRGVLTLPHEEQEKELLAIGEHFGLRGAAIDKVNAEAIKTESSRVVSGALNAVKSMTLTVVDGDFPREVIAGQNLTFAAYQMPRRRNTPQAYDANQKGPGEKKSGVLKIGKLENIRHAAPIASSSIRWLPIGLSLAMLGALLWSTRTERS